MGLRGIPIVISFWMGIAAIVCGFKVLRRVRQQPYWLRGALAAIGILSGSIPVLLFMFFITAPPPFLIKRTLARNACVNNLRQIDGLKEQWALEKRKTATDTPTWDDLIGSDKYIKVRPSCPANGTYTLNNMAHKPQCSIRDHTLH
jgi:hypothetical protein